MASNIAQADMDTLWAAINASSTGPYNDVGTDVGVFTPGLLSSAFERNCASLIALVEFLIANTADPSSSAANAIKCSAQRKMVKDTLAKACMRVKSATSDTDDRVAYSDRIIAKLVSRYNLAVRPDAL